MEAIKSIVIKERPIDLAVLYHRIRELEESVKSLMSEESTLKIRTAAGIEIIPQDQIIRCQSDNNYTAIVLKCGKKIIASKTLKFIQENLLENEFMRVHASHLIAKSQVCRISTVRGRTLTLSNGDRIPVSRSFQSAVDAAFA